MRAKTSSKNLGKLMRSSERASAAESHQNRNDQKEEEPINDSTAITIAANGNRVHDELQQADDDLFEQVLKDAFNTKKNFFLHDEPKGHESEDISIMGLIDGAKERLAAEKELNNTVNTKAPVKFDEVIEFIDDGAEEIVLDKKTSSPTKTIKLANINVASPIRGNPIIDLDGRVNGTKMNSEEENLKNQQLDAIQLMEMGRGPPISFINGQSHASAFTTVKREASEVSMGAVDDVDLERVERAQKNITCNEKEQLDYMINRNLHEFAGFDNVLGPLSNGEFTTFSSNRSPVIGCDLGMVNPITAANMNVFQTCTSNGRLLPGMPRKHFATSDGVSIPRMRPGPQKAPITYVLHNPSSNANSIFSISDLYASPQSSPPPTNVVSPPNESISRKKKNKKYAKLAAAAEKKKEEEEREAKKEKEEEELGATKEKEDEVICENKEKEEEVIEEDDDEKENGKPDGLTDEEREARRLKNRKAREKKRVKKNEEKAEAEARAAEALAKQKEEERKIQQEEQRLLAEERRKMKKNRQNYQIQQQTAGTNATKDDSNKENSDEKREMTPGGKAEKDKKKEKNVSNQYTNTGEILDAFLTRGIIPADECKEALLSLLKELGINTLEELADKNGGKKKKRELLKKLRAQQQKEQQQNNNNNNNAKKNQPKTAAAAPESDDESNSEKKASEKMDEVAVAASITKRCSSGAGQQSEEDDDQSYVSAQENLGGSNSRLSTPPLQAEFVDAPQARDDPLDNVMSDPNNYRDDAEVDKVAKQLQDEENEFITVGKNKKKNKKASIPNETGSFSPPKSRSVHPDPKTLSTATPSVSNFSTTSSAAPQQHQHQRNNGRPVAHPTTLGDFMETTKKETHKNTKHKKPTAGPSTGNKKQTSFDEPQPSSPVFDDAVEAPISVITSPSAFSYADAAKKTSGENTPAHEMSPVPPPVNAPTLASSAPSTSKKVQSTPQNGPETTEKRKSPTPPPLEPVTFPAQPSFASAVSGVQLPPSSAAAATSDISFGYEETPEDKQKQQLKKNKSASPQSSKSQSPEPKTEKKTSSSSEPEPQSQQSASKKSGQKNSNQARGGMNGKQLMSVFDAAAAQNGSPANVQVVPAHLTQDNVAIEILNSWEKGWADFHKGSAPVYYNDFIKNKNK